MILSGPTQVQLVPPSTNVVIGHVILDLGQHNAFISMGGGKTIKAPIGPGLLNAIENFVAAVVEVDQGWGVGTSTIVQP